MKKIIYSTLISVGFLWVVLVVYFHYYPRQVSVVAETTSAQAQPITAATTVQIPTMKTNIVLVVNKIIRLTSETNIISLDDYDPQTGIHNKFGPQFQLLRTGTSMTVWDPEGNLGSKPITLADDMRLNLNTPRGKKVNTLYVWTTDTNSSPTELQTQFYGYR